MKRFFKFLSLFYLLTTSVLTLANDISGTGWIGREDDGDKTIYLFEKDGTFTYLGVISITGNEGYVYGDDNETWRFVKDILVISHNDGYRTCSLRRDQSNLDRMRGSCSNVKGQVNQIELFLIR